MHETTTQFFTPVFSLTTLFAAAYLLPALIPLLKLIPRVTYYGGFGVATFCGVALLAATPSVPGALGTAVAVALGGWYAVGAVRHYRRLLSESRSTPSIQST